MKLKKPKTLEELAPPDREVCQVLASLGAVFNTAQLIKHEFNSSGLKGYIGLSLLPFLYPLCLPVMILLCLYILLLHAYVFTDLLYSDNHCLLMSSYLGVGMVLNKEKRVRLADALARSQGALGGAGASAPSAPIDTSQVMPTPAPSAPIVAIPLATARASPTPTPIERNKSVVAIESEEEEDTVEGPVFKRRRALAETTSHSTTIGRPVSFRDHPPSASSPCGLLALEGGGESALGNEHTPPAPELPAVLQHALKSFQERGTMEDLDEEMNREHMGRGLGEFLVHSNALASKAEARSKEQLALVEAKAKEDLVLAEEKKKDELTQHARVFATRETTLLQELSSLRQSEKDVKKRLFDKDQEYTDLESRVLPLRTRVVELEEEAEATKAKMAKLEERTTNQEVQLGRVEGELT